MGNVQRPLTESPPMAAAAMRPILHVRLLGQAHVGFSSGEPAPATLLQPRKLALLAYLAAEDRAVPRSELACALWGDTPDERARRTLSQVLHSIRQDCGFDPFIVQGRSLLLDPERVVSDIAEFYRAVESRPPEEVVAQYSGPFMPGFAVSGASSFEDWYAQQCERFDLAFADVAWRAAEQCADARVSLKYLEAAARARPWDQSILRRRMRCLDESGEAAAAIALFETYRTQLRESLGTQPAAETMAVVREIAEAVEHVAEEAAQYPAAAVPPLEETITDVRTATPARRRWMPQVASAAVLAASVLFGVYVSQWAAGSDDARRVVSLAGFSVSGGDFERRNGVRQQFTSQLSADTTFALDVTNAEGADLVVSGALDLADGVRGTVVLKKASGTVLATLPLAYPSESDAAAIADVVRQIRRMIAIAMAPDEESRNAARLEYRVDDAMAAVERGAFESAAAALLDIERQLGIVDLDERARESVQSRVSEVRGWSAALQGNLAASVPLFEHAISALDNPARSDIASRQRQIYLHFTAWSVAVEDRRDHLMQIFRHARAIEPARRSAETWVTIAQAYYHLGMYADAYASAVSARGNASTTTNPQLALLLFKSAFMLRNDRIARAECAAIRSSMPTQWPAVVCAAMAAGWADASYRPEALIAELRKIEDPEPSRTMIIAQVLPLLAAACARRGDYVNAELLMRDLPVIAGSDEHQLFRAVALAALGRSDDANSVLDELKRTSGGRRTLQSYARLLSS